MKCKQRVIDQPNNDSEIGSTLCFVQQMKMNVVKQIKGSINKKVICEGNFGSDALKTKNATQAMRKIIEFTNASM